MLHYVSKGEGEILARVGVGDALCALFLLLLFDFTCHDGHVVSPPASHNRSVCVFRDPKIHELPRFIQCDLYAMWPMLRMEFLILRPPYTSTTPSSIASRSSARFDRRFMTEQYSGVVVPLVLSIATEINHHSFQLTCTHACQTLLRYRSFSCPSADTRVTSP